MTDKYDNSGALFKNDRKEKDTHPDYNGNAMIDGKEMWVSGWIKKGKKGSFMSLAFKPKDAAKAAPARKPAREEQGFYDREDAPF